MRHPLRGEAEGRVPNDEYMKATHGRRLLNGDIANLSIGQGDMQVTPLQMAQAMESANGGILSGASRPTGADIR
jgi:penicillin-binding protein 2